MRPTNTDCLVRLPAEYVNLPSESAYLVTCLASQPAYRVYLPAH